MHLSRRHKRRVVAKYRAGTSIPDLSNEFGITVGQVRSLLRQSGEELEPDEVNRGGLLAVFTPSHGS